MVTIGINLSPTVSVLSYALSLIPSTWTISCFGGSEDSTDFVCSDEASEAAPAVVRESLEVSLTVL